MDHGIAVNILTRKIIAEIVVIFEVSHGATN